MPGKRFIVRPVTEVLNSCTATEVRITFCSDKVTYSVPFGMHLDGKCLVTFLLDNRDLSVKHTQLNTG